MEEAVAQLVGGEGEAAAAAAAALQAAVKARSLDVLGLVSLAAQRPDAAVGGTQLISCLCACLQVGLLKRPLTDEHDHEARARAVQLLSQVCAAAAACPVLGGSATAAAAPLHRDPVRARTHCCTHALVLLRRWPWTRLKRCCRVTWP